MTDATLMDLWRKAVKCAYRASGDVECHHIIPRNHMLLRYDVLNGIPLTFQQHREAETPMGRERLMRTLGKNRREYLLKRENEILAQYLVERGITRQEWLRECAEELRAIIKGAE